MAWTLVNGLFISFGLARSTARWVGGYYTVPGGWAGGAGSRDRAVWLGPVPFQHCRGGQASWVDYFCADDLNKQQANSEARLAKTTFCAFMGAVSGARFPPGFCGRRCVIHGISRKQKMSTGPDPCGSMRIHRDQRQNMQVYSLTKTIAAPSYAWSPPLASHKKSS